MREQGGGSDRLRGERTEFVEVRDTILIADSDPRMLAFGEVNLRLEGFDVIAVREGAVALERAIEARPKLVILDVAMPDVDGYEVCRRLRGHPRTAHTRVIFLTAKLAVRDRIHALTAGADAYLLKPYDPTELVVRVATTLQRSAELRGLSPLTGLPGNNRIELEVARRLDEGAPLAVAYADLNDFKPFNDAYGFLRGDEVLLATARILADALSHHAGPDAFLGHIGGDDFVLVCHPDEVEAVCAEATARFDDRIPDLYDAQDRDMGGLVMRDRRGQLQHFPLLTIALGVATTVRRTFTDHREIVEVATEMKRFLKRHRRPCSAFAIDERATVAS